MKAMTTLLFVLFSSHFAYATTAPSAKVMPLQSFGVSFNCNASGEVEFSQWSVVGQTSVWSPANGYYDSYNVSFQSSDKSPQIFVNGDTVYMRVNPSQSERSMQILPIGRFNIDVAACDPSDEGNGYGATFEADILDVTLNQGISLYVAPTAKKCGPNGEMLSALIVKTAGGTYTISQNKPSFCQ